MSNELIDLTKDPSDIPEEFNIKIKPKKTCIYPTYCTKVENPQPRDLVFGTLDDIKHPVKHDKNFGPRFLIIEAVTGFAPVPINVIQAWINGVQQVCDEREVRNSMAEHHLST